MDGELVHNVLFRVSFQLPKDCRSLLVYRAVDRSNHKGKFLPQPCPETFKPSILEHRQYQAQKEQPSASCYAIMSGLKTVSLR